MRFASAPSPKTPAAIADYGPLEDETGTKAIEIESLRPGPKGLIARIKGVTTREGAEALTGTKLYIGRDRLPPPAEDEWYHSDLIGLAAYDAFEVQIGTVVAVYNFGAGDIIEVKLDRAAATICCCPSPTPPCPRSTPRSAA